MTALTDSTPVAVEEGRRIPRRRPSLRLLGGLLLPLAILVLWQVLSEAGIFRANRLPPPTAVLEELANQLLRKNLLGHIAVTLQRVLLGFGAGTIAAVILGSLTGYSRLARELLDPTLQALKSVPSLAWVPLFILWFGIFETSKVVLIAVGCFFPVYLNLMSGIQEVDRKLVEVARMFGYSRLRLVGRVLLPATLPSFLVGMRSGLALGWMFVIAAELMGASKGLGFLMIDGQQTGRPTLIIGALILFACIGKLTDWLLAVVTRPWLAWRDTFGTMAAPDAAR